jgi:hypothetical protein
MIAPLHHPPCRMGNAFYGALCGSRRFSLALILILHRHCSDDALEQRGDILRTKLFLSAVKVIDLNYLGLRKVGH